MSLRKLGLVFVTTAFTYLIVTPIKISELSLLRPARAEVIIGDEFRLGDVSIEELFPSLGSLVGVLLAAILTIAGLTATAFLLIGGFKFITSGGDQKAVSSAKDTMTNALLGLIIVFVSYWIIQIVETITGVPIL